MDPFASVALEMSVPTRVHGLGHMRPSPAAVMADQHHIHSNQLICIPVTSLGVPGLCLADSLTPRGDPLCMHRQ